MTQNSLTTTRRRASTRTTNNHSDSNSSNDSASKTATKSFNESFSSDTLPSRIPIKSPARRSSTSAAAIGGMAVAYSPIRNKNTHSSFNVFNGSAGSNELNSSPSDYARKLLDLKNAMELLKTPPAPQSGYSNPSSAFSSGHHQIPNTSANAVYSYTPLKSSALTNQISPSFASSIDESMEISMEILDDDSSTINNIINNDASLLLEAYHDEDTVSTQSRVIKHNELFSSPSPNFSSPYLSSDEMKKRLEATREAFQKSLEAQKRRLRSSYFDNQEDESSYSDLSIDSLKSTKNQLDKIKREINELIESDIEELERHSSKEKDEDVNLLNNPPSDSYFAAILKYLIIFSVSSIIFTYLFITYTPSIKANYSHILELPENGNILDKLEDFLNFLLQDD